MIRAYKTTCLVLIDEDDVKNLVTIDTVIKFCKKEIIIDLEEDRDDTVGFCSANIIWDEMTEISEDELQKYLKNPSRAVIEYEDEDPN